MSNQDQTVHIFQKSTQEEVRASISHYKGKDYINLRVSYKAEDGEFKPSKKGLTISKDLLKELETAVKKLRKAVGPDKGQRGDSDHL